MKRIALLLVALLAATALADPPRVVPVPKPLTPDKRERLEGASPGEMFQMAAEPASKWRLEGNATGCDLRVFDNGKTGVLVAKTPGIVGVIVTGPAGDSTFLDVVVGGVVPPKPDPKDPLKEQLKAALEADSEKDIAKRTSLCKDLAGLYRKISTDYCSDTKLGTPEELFAFARVSVDALLKPGVLFEVRKVMSQELKTLLPIVEAPLTDAQRKATADLFLRAAVALEGL